MIKLLGLPLDLAGESPSLGSWLRRASAPWSTWFPAKYGDGWRLLCGDWKEEVIGRGKFSDVQLMLPRSKVLSSAEERREMYAESELIMNILWSTSCSYFSTCTFMWNAQTSSKTNTELSSVLKEASASHKSTRTAQGTASTKHFLSHLKLQSRDINKPRMLAESRQSVCEHLHHHR